MDDRVDRVQKRRLGETLQNAGLESKYWTHVFKARIPKVPLNEKALKSLSHSTITQLKKCIRFKWEEIALNEFLEVSDDDFEVQRLYPIEDRVKEGTTVIQEMKLLQARGDCRADSSMKLREEQMRHVLWMPKEYSITNYENVSFADVIKLYEFQIHELNTLRSKIEPQINNATLLQKASYGLALKGILISRQIQDSQIKDTVLETPSYREIPTRPSSTVELEFVSKSQSKMFWNVLDKVGISIALNAKDGHYKLRVKTTERCWGFDVSEFSEPEQFCSRHSYSVIRTHSCVIDSKDLRLSRQAIHELNKILCDIENSTEIIQKKCTDFLQKFGSHVIVGEVHFGGIFGWQVSSNNNCETKLYCLNDVLQAFKSATHTVFGIGGVQWTDNVPTCENPSNLSSYAGMLSKEGIIIGGPKETDDFSLWNVGVAMSNGTWAVIDRGRTGSGDFVGIWEIVRKEKGVKHAIMLSNRLQHAWEIMFDSQKETMLRVGRKLNEWANIENTGNYVIEQLYRTLMTMADFSRLSEGKSFQVWSHSMVGEKHFQSLLQSILDNKFSFTSQQLYQVRYLLFKIFAERLSSYKDSGRLMRWIHVERMEYGVPNFLKGDSPEDISTFLDVIGKKMLSAIRVIMRKNKRTFLTDPMHLNRINIQISSEFALLVHRTKQHLEKPDKAKYLDFLLRALQDQLAYNSGRQMFEEIVTSEKLESFAKMTVRLWHIFTFSHFRIQGSINEELSLSCLEDAMNHQIESKPREMITVSRKVSVSNGCETKVLKHLGLTDYCHSKLSLQDVMTCGTHATSYHAAKILQKIIMANSNGRDEVVRANVEDNIEEMASSSYEVDESLPADIASLLTSFSTKQTSQVALNPQDVNVALFACSDLMLRQTLVQKMFKCQLAVPFIFPLLTTDSWMCSVWALRSIVMEWRNTNHEMVECSVTEHDATNIVSFVRFGDQHSFSKSKLMNLLLSDHSLKKTFFNRDSPQGDTERMIANGVVEASWYLPSGKDYDIFDNVVMFLNLRGEATKYPKQLQIIMKLSCVVVVCMDITSLSDHCVMAQMKVMHNYCKHVVLLLMANEIAAMKSEILGALLLNYRKKTGNATFIIGFNEKGMKNPNNLKEDTQNAIAKCLTHKQGTSILDVCYYTQGLEIEVDEMNPSCHIGQQLAEKVCFYLETKQANILKTQILPLQGRLWSELCHLSKKRRNPGDKSQIDELQETIEASSKRILLRQEQFNRARYMSPIMRTFLSVLIQKRNEPVVISFFLRWLKLYFDQQSRKSIPLLQQRYISARKEYDAAKGNKNESEMKTKVVHLEQELSAASVGVKHLMREIGQLYEAVMESNVKLQPKNMESIEQLPRIVAKLLLLGHAIEIMDGDTSTVPLTWIKAILCSIAEIVGAKKVFVLSVIGIQSSGKSTLLNTMFGTDFGVSSGRCTRGVYITLVKMKADSHFEYTVVVDTEGLRAPELDQMNHIHDNELATLVIGLGDITMINIKGENVVEIEDILQIAVHAFLRMKMVNTQFQLQQACVFLHQNVSAISAKERTGFGTQKFLDKLDNMTKEAANSEDISDIVAFNQVIRFDMDKYVWHFSDLWLGDPPMAPVNPEYSEKVLEVKQFVTQEMTKSQTTFLTFADLAFRVNDLWRAITAEDFVFSFRNSLAVKAYTQLESKYNEFIWNVEDDIMKWLTKDALINLQRCRSNEDLQTCCTYLTKVMEDKIESLSGKAHSDLMSFIDSSNLKNILVTWRDAKLISLGHAVDVVRNKVKRDISDQMESQKFELVQKERQKETERLIIRNARDLADEMRTEQATEAQLHAKFDIVWQDWVKKVGATCNKKTENTSICDEVERMLWKLLPKDRALLNKELALHKLSNPVDVHKADSLKEVDICPEYISVPIQEGNFNHENNNLCVREAFSKAKELLQKVDENLFNIQSQKSKFVITYATSVIRIILDGVQEHNEKRYDKFTLLPNFTVKLVVHACRHAIFVFNQMQNDYQLTHGIQGKLEACKNTFWNYFKNLVAQSTTEDIVADLICDRMEERIKHVVFGRMPNEIVEYTSAKYKSKKDLVISILTYLARKNDFDEYKSYLEHAKSYAFEWIKMETNHEFFDENRSGRTRYASYAEVHIKYIIHSMEICSSTATTLVKKTPKESQNISSWVSLFCDSMKKEIALPETDLEQVLEFRVTDFSNLHRLIVARLPALKKKTLASFKKTTAENIIWKGTVPYREIMARLWDCPAQCPFCREPCQWTDSNHVNNVDHRCIQHRPQGVGGLKWAPTNMLCVENCCYLVQTKGNQFSCGACDKQCQKSGKCSGQEDSLHDYMKYKMYIPDWDIEPSPTMDHSDYWRWFMVKYKKDLSKRYCAEVLVTPNGWDNITIDRACSSLRD